MYIYMYIYIYIRQTSSGVLKASQPPLLVRTSFGSGFLLRHPACKNNFLPSNVYYVLSYGVHCTYLVIIVQRRLCNKLYLCITDEIFMYS